MAQLLAGLVLFLGIHSLSVVAPATRDRWAERLGVATWKGLYAVLSLASFVLLLHGYGLARHVSGVLYVPPSWLRSTALIVMLPVFPLALAAYLPGRIQTAVRHPLLAATKAWAVAHLLANGTLADVLLFGGFLVWAITDRVSLERRAPRPIATAPPARWNDAIAVVLGLTLYAAFLAGLHRALIGVSPLG